MCILAAHSPPVTKALNSRAPRVGVWVLLLWWANYREFAGWHGWLSVQLVARTFLAWWLLATGWQAE